MHSNEAKLLREILEVLRESVRLQKRSDERLENIECQLYHIEFELTPTTTISVAIQFSGDITMADNALVLNVGQSSQATIAAFLADGVTPSGGVPSSVSFNFSDPSATVVLNADGVSATVTGVADSAGVAVSGVASFTITDTDGAVSQWNQAFTVQTNAVTPPPPDQLTQSVAVQFSAPTP